MSKKKEVKKVEKQTKDKTEKKMSIRNYCIDDKRLKGKESAFATWVRVNFPEESMNRTFEDWHKKSTSFFSSPVQ
jgi:hypothetical protein